MKINTFLFLGVLSSVLVGNSAAAETETQSSAAPTVTQNTSTAVSSTQLEQTAPAHFTEQYSGIDLQVESSEPFFNTATQDPVRPACLNNTQIEVFDAKAGSKDSFVILPALVPDMESFRESLKTYESTANKDTRYTVPLKVHLHSPKLFSEIAAELTARLGSTVKPSHIQVAKVMLLQIIGKVGGKDQLIKHIPKLDDVNLGDVKSGTTNLLIFRASSINAVEKCWVKGTLAELQEFAKDADNVSGRLVLPGFKGKLSQLVFAADRVLRDRISHQVFGDAKQTDIVRWSSSSGSSGLHINIGGFKLGDFSGDTSSLQEVESKRFLSRDLLQTTIESYLTTSVISKWGLELPPELGKFSDDVARFFLAEQKTYDARIEKVADKNVYNVIVDELKFSRPVQVSDESLEYNGKQINDTDSKDSFNYAQIVDAKSDSKMNFNSDVTVKRKSGTKYVPTAVKLVLLSEGDLQAKIRKELRNYGNPQEAKFAYDLSCPVDTTFSEKNSVAGSGSGELISLSFLRDKVNDFQLSHYPITQTFHGPSVPGAGETERNDVTVTVNRDGTGQAVLRVEGAGFPKASSPFTVQILKMGEMLEEVLVPAAPASQHGFRFSISKTQPIQLKKETIDSLFWPSQIVSRP